MSFSRRFLICAAAALFAALGLAPAAAAQSGLIGRTVVTCVAAVRPGDTPRAMLVMRDRFDCAGKQSAHGRGSYWVRSQPIAPGTQDRVRFASVWQHQATLYALYADGGLFRVVIDGHGATARVQLGAILEQRLPARDVPLERLMWRVDDSANLFGIVNGARLASADESAAANLRLGALYAAFAGMCLALLVYNLAIWAALRHGFQLAYCGMVAMLLVYAASSSGALAWAFPGIENNTRLRINYIALAASGSMALLFARCFFEPRVFRGWLNVALPAMVALLMTAAIAFALLAPRGIGLLNGFYAAAFMLEMGTALPVLYFAWKRRSDFLWLFAVAWAAPILLAALRVAANLGMLPWSFLLDNSTLASMTVEALVSSLAIAYRIRLLSRERDVAREHEIAARLLADTDPLTGLMNRRAFLREAIGRQGAQMLLVADIDHFKRVNDTLGHDGGDEVLRIVARALRAAAPHGALIARIGGEEFAVVAAAGDVAGAAGAILERIRAERMPFDLTVTASLGTATGALTSETEWNALYRRADRSLFEAKAAGRDRSRHSDNRVAAA